MHAIVTHPLSPRAGISHVIGKQIMRGVAVSKAPTMPIGVRDEAGRMLLAMKPAEFAAYFRRVLPALQAKPPVAPAGAIAAGTGSTKDRFPAIRP